MSFTDDRLRRWFASHSRENVGDEHPSSEQLWALTAGELTAAASRELIDHVSRCPACAEDLRLTRQLVAAADDDRAMEAPVPAPRLADAGWLRNLGLAAALVAVAVGVGWQLARSPEVPFRQGEEQRVSSLLDLGASVPRGELRLRWTGPEDALYDLVVTTDDLRTIVAIEGLAATELLVPEKELAGLETGAILFWQVDAVLPDGSRISSLSFDVRLADE